jgi:hypothetical protein
MPSSSTVFEDQRGRRSVACRKLFGIVTLCSEGDLSLRATLGQKKNLAGVPQCSAPSWPGFISRLPDTHRLFHSHPNLGEGARGKAVLHHRYKRGAERKVRVFYEPNRALPPERKRVPKGARQMDVYAIVTDKIVNLLEQEVIPWRRPWDSLDLPRNLVSRKPYRGINVRREVA